jgi:hypothetical protein
VIHLPLIFLTNYFTCFFQPERPLQGSGIFARPDECRAIVIPIDAASHGLDIPTIATGVHYDVDCAVNTFVRGVGQTAVSLDSYPVLNYSLTMKKQRSLRTASENSGVVP